MNNQSGKIKLIAFILLGIVLGSGSIFFAFYTARLVYINLTAADAAAHRSGGMFIGAIAFPLAALLFGWLGWRCVKAAYRAAGK